MMLRSFFRYAVPACILSLSSVHVMAEETADPGLDEVGPSMDLSVVYEFFVGGFQIAELEFDLDLTDRDYQAQSKASTSGVLDFIIKGRAISEAEGKRTKHGQVRPVSYATRYESRSNEQAVQIAYAGAIPKNIKIEPLDKPEVIAVSHEQKVGALDPLSASVAILTPSQGAPLCLRTVPVFDGQYRYDIILLPPDPERMDPNAPAPEWDTPLTRCFGIYERIAGFEDPITKSSRYVPFDIWFDEVDDRVFRAVRIAGKTKLGYAIGRLRIPE